MTDNEIRTTISTVIDSPVSRGEAKAIKRCIKRRSHSVRIILPLKKHIVIYDTLNKEFSSTSLTG